NREIFHTALHHKTAERFTVCARRNAGWHWGLYTGLNYRFGVKSRFNFTGNRKFFTMPLFLMVC
ncbi:MAG TPA: hypothetical protein PLY97_11625, partial [Acidocella sp.]|nr:hypothetical protein [Acidocella sp.]